MNHCLRHTCYISQFFFPSMRKNRKKHVSRFRVARQSLSLRHSMFGDLKAVSRSLDMISGMSWNLSIPTEESVKITTSAGRSKSLVQLHCGEHKPRLRTECGNRVDKTLPCGILSWQYIAVLSDFSFGVVSMWLRVRMTSDEYLVLLSGCSKWTDRRLSVTRVAYRVSDIPYCVASSGDRKSVV